MDKNKGIPSALVHVPAKEQQEYVVQMAFELPDVDKEHKLTVHFNDTQGYSFHIYASSIMEAIDRAWQVLMVMKAELVTGYPAILEEIDDDDITYHSLHSFRAFLLDKHIIKKWMLLEPMSMQVCLLSDEEKLKDFTADVVYSEMKNTVSDVEDFLKDK